MNCRKRTEAIIMFSCCSLSKPTASVFLSFFFSDQLLIVHENIIYHRNLLPGHNKLARLAEYSMSVNKNAYLQTHRLP